MEDSTTEAPQPAASPAETAQAPGPEKQSGNDTTATVKNFALDYWRECQQILLHPIRFFDNMPTTGGFLEPAKFLFIASTINAVLSALGQLKFEAFLISFFVTPIMTLLCSLIAAGLCSLMKGKGTFEGTFRLFAYSEATLLLQWIPAVGIIAFLYTFGLNYLGLRKVHDLPEPQTLAVVLLATILSVIVALMTALGVFLRNMLHF